jgi:hypothetical protein
VKKLLLVVAVAAIAFLIVVGLSAQTRSGSSTGSTGVNYQPPKMVTQKAMNPMPGPNAKQQTKQSTIGKDKAMVKTSKDNSFWVEEIDIDGSGNPVEAQMLWDDTNKVLYTYADKPFQCKDGSSGNGDFLIAAYGKGNIMKKPAGSGWWAASLDQGQCKARTDELFGCKFDASGKNTACGVANLNEKTNDLTIVEATTTSIQ